MMISVGDIVLCDAHPVPCKVGLILPYNSNANIYVEYNLGGQVVFDWIFNWEISKNYKSI